MYIRFKNILIILSIIISIWIPFINENCVSAFEVQETEGKKYYFSSETGEMLTGIQEIEDKKYYFSEETGEMLAGIQEIESKKYYFFEKTGEMLAGIQEIEGEKYYFSEEVGIMLFGWQEISGGKYYFSLENGNMVYGKKKIGRKTYFFSKKGILQTNGWVNDKNNTYYSGKDGVLCSGWKTIKNKKYYFSPVNNKMLKGLQEIKGKIYIFKNNGCLASSNKVTLVNNGKNIYCVKPDGRAASGWQVINNTLYYVSEKGKVKRNKLYQGIILTKTGAAKKDFNTKLKIMVMKIMRSITNEKMSKDQKLRKCWDYISGGTFRYASKYPNLKIHGWQKRTAYNMFSTHTGNCYSYACAFAALAEESGYKPYIVCGRVHGSRDHASDGFTRHAWVRINGRNYDPEGQYAGWLRGIYAKNVYPAAHKVQKVVVY